jgi:hypothetical protein
MSALTKRASEKQLLASQFTERHLVGHVWTHTSSFYASGNSHRLMD